MRKPPPLWVVYQPVVQGLPGGTHVVCEQAEWDAIQCHDPSGRLLVRAGIASEAEADQLARDSTPALRHSPRMYR